MTDVKPLVWEGPYPSNGFKKGRWVAGNFSVVRKGKAYWRVYRNFIDEKDAIYPSAEEAKAAAQADYERHVLSCLTNQPDPKALDTCPKCGGPDSQGYACGCYERPNPDTFTRAEVLAVIDAQMGELTSDITTSEASGAEIDAMRAARQALEDLRAHFEKDKV